MSNDASMLSWSGPDVEETAYGYVGVVKGYSAASLGAPEAEVLATERPCTASSASSIAFPKKKGLRAVVCSRARVDVFRATTSCADNVSDFAMTGKTLVNCDNRCMYPMSFAISLSI
jgi:hypothetical protein